MLLCKYEGKNGAKRVYQKIMVSIHATLVVCDYMCYCCKVTSSKREMSIVTLHYVT